MIDLYEIVPDFVEKQELVLPSSYVSDASDKRLECATCDDVVECFLDYLTGHRYDAILEEEPSAVSRIDMWFDVFVDDCIEPVSVGGDA